MSKIISTIVIIALPIIIFVMSCVCSPGYYQPMFKEPVGIVMLAGGLIWLMIGALLLMITNGWRRRVACILVTTPVILLTMLGPAVLTIMTALGPVVGTTD